jgi:predicted RND superfamily exporter protein
MLLATSNDYGMSIVQCFTFHGRSDVREAMHINGLGILLSAFTNLEGCGSLALSVHRGIASVGMVSLVGLTGCLLAALSTVPAVLQVWGRPHPTAERS